MPRIKSAERQVQVPWTDLGRSPRALYRARKLNRFPVFFFRHFIYFFAVKNISFNLYCFKKRTFGNLGGK